MRARLTGIRDRLCAGIPVDFDWSLESRLAAVQSNEWVWKNPTRTAVHHVQYYLVLDLDLARVACTALPAV